MSKSLAFAIFAIAAFSVFVKAAPSENKDGNCPAVCANTFEYLPVCGSDGQTYPNPGALECAKKCKSDLQQASVGACGEIATTSGSITETTIPSENQEKCDIPCASTLEIAPVCGSNGKTYVNPGDLKCAKKCKPELEQVKAGPCQDGVEN